MRPTTPALAALALTLIPALAHAQATPVCLESRGAKDAAYSAKPIAAPGCVQPARYDVSIVDGCIGVYGAPDLVLTNGLVVASGPSWGATVDARGPDPVVIPNCPGAKPVALTPVSTLETSSSAARAKLLSDARPDVRAAALEATARDQTFEVACTQLSAFLREAPSFGEARRAEARRALSLAKEPCLTDAAFEVATTSPILNADAQGALARSTRDHDARERLVLRLVARGVDAEVLATSLTDGASLKLSTALISIAQNPADVGYESARRVLDVLNVSYELDERPLPTDDDPRRRASPPDPTREPRGEGPPERPPFEEEPEPGGGFGLSFNVGWLVQDAPFRDPLALTLWGGAKIFPDDENRRGLFFAPGLAATIADTGYEVVPTVRLGWAFLAPPEVYPELDLLSRTATFVEGYTLAGIRTPLGGQNVGLRVGVGVSSPILLFLSLLTLANVNSGGSDRPPDADTLPLPNGIELLFDADLVTGEQVGRLNLTVGF